MFHVTCVTLLKAPCNGSLEEILFSLGMFSTLDQYNHLGEGWSNDIVILKRSFGGFLKKPELLVMVGVMGDPGLRAAGQSPCLIK